MCANVSLGLYPSTLNVPMGPFFNSSTNTHSCLMTLGFSLTSNKYVCFQDFFVVFCCLCAFGCMRKCNIDYCLPKCVIILHLICRYNLTCSDGKIYLGVLFFGANGHSPSSTSNGGKGSSYLFQQNMWDTTDAVRGAKYPTATLAAVTNCLGNQNCFFPVTDGNVLGGNLLFGCGCPIGQFGEAYPSCLPCPAGALLRFVIA